MKTMFDFCFSLKPDGQVQAATVKKMSIVMLCKECRYEHVKMLRPSKQERLPTMAGDEGLGVCDGRKEEVGKLKKWEHAALGRCRSTASTLA